MGWAYCGKDELGRYIGYGVIATCDEMNCKKEIDRGLGCVCGDMHGGGDYGCGKYFCGQHLFLGPEQLCKKCLDNFIKENPDWLDDKEFEE